MKKLYKKIILLIIAAYTIFTIISQQKTLNQYSQKSEELSQEIAEETQTKEELAKQKANVDSLDFIEKMAREKLDMYLPNERGLYRSRNVVLQFTAK